MAENENKELKFAWGIDVEGILKNMNFEANLTLDFVNEYPDLVKKVESALTDIINHYKDQIIQGKWRFKK